MTQFFEGLQFDKPLVAFDLETTTNEVDTARIVQVSFIKIRPNYGTTEIYETLVNPTVPIPAESTKVHHITDAMVSDKPIFAELADDIYGFVSGCAFIGYNIMTFDLPVLAVEFSRVDQARFEFNPDAKQVIDAMVIFHRNVKRDLSFAYEYLVGEKLEGAHDANEDVMATIAVLKKMLEKWELPQSLDGLDEYCKQPPEGYVDRKRKLKWVDGKAVFQFGKHKGKTLQRTIQIDVQYVKWLAGPDFNADADFKTILSDALDGRFPAEN